MLKRSASPRKARKSSSPSPASPPTSAATFKSIQSWKPASQASTRWAISRAARPSLTFLTTTSASSAPISFEKGSASTDGRPVPYTLFIDPQLGRVGLTESQARAQNRKIRIAKMPMSHVARALEVDESRGFMKAIVDAESAQILGAAVLGLEGGEVMSMLQLAMMGKLPYTTLRDAVFSHPNLSESLNNLFLASNFVS